MLTRIIIYIALNICQFWVYETRSLCDVFNVKSLTRAAVNQKPWMHPWQIIIPACEMALYILKRHPRSNEWRCYLRIVARAELQYVLVHLYIWCVYSWIKLYYHMLYETFCGPFLLPQSFSIIIFYYFCYNNKSGSSNSIIRSNFVANNN